MKRELGGKVRCVLLEKTFDIGPFDRNQHVRHWIFFGVIKEGERFENVHPVVARPRILPCEAGKEMLQAELLSRDVKVDKVSLSAPAGQAARDS